MKQAKRNPAPDLENLLNRGFRYACALTHNETEAEDLIQEACYQLLKRKKEIEPAALFTVIRHRFIDRFRHDKRFPKVSLDNPQREGPTLQLLVVKDEADLVADADALDKAIGTLRIEEREALFLWAVEGYTAREIAKMSSDPINTVLSRLHRGRQKLRSILKSNMSKVA
jgi:RNA polymerase sigma-70 factor, ECF subfamily